MLHGITQCYLPPGRGDIPAITPSEAEYQLEAGTRHWFGRVSGHIPSQRIVRLGGFESAVRALGRRVVIVADD